MVEHSLILRLKTRCAIYVCGVGTEEEEVCKMDPGMSFFLYQEWGVIKWLFALENS